MAKKKKLTIEISQEDYDELLGYSERSASELTPEMIVEDLVHDFLDEEADYDD